MHTEQENKDNTNQTISQLLKTKRDFFKQLVLFYNRLDLITNYFTNKLKDTNDDLSNFIDNHTNSQENNDGYAKPNFNGKEQVVLNTYKENLMQELDEVFSVLAYYKNIVQTELMSFDIDDDLNKLMQHLFSFQSINDEFEKEFKNIKKFIKASDLQTKADRSVLKDELVLTNNYTSQDFISLLENIKFNFDDAMFLPAFNGMVFTAWNLPDKDIPKASYNVFNAFGNLGWFFCNEFNEYFNKKQNDTRYATSNNIMFNSGLWSLNTIFTICTIFNVLTASTKNFLAFFNYK